MSSLKKQIIDSVHSGTFLEVIDHAYLDNRDDRTVVDQEVAALHNKGKINAIAEFRRLNRSEKQHDFFMIRHVLEKALPSIDAPVTSVMDCVKHLVEEAGTLLPPFIQFCEANTQRPEEVLSASLADVDKTFDFITPAIIAGSNQQLVKYADRAVKLCSHEDFQIRCRAVHALGRITYDDRKELIDNSLQAIQKVIEDNYDEYLFAAALRSVFSLYKADSSSEKFATKLMSHILQYPDDAVLYAASQLLFFEAKKIPVSLIDLLLKALVKTNCQHDGTIKDIDHGLCSLFQHSMHEKVISFLEAILVQSEQKLSIKQFDSVIRKIRENKECSLDSLVTRWLLSKQVTLCHAAADLLHDHSDKGIAIKADISQLAELPEGIHVFLTRKACGWFFHKPVSATSFIVSLIDSSPDKEIQLIADILFNPLLISYSGNAKDYLIQTIEASSEKVKQVVNTLLERLDSYHESLEFSQNIDELLPTQAQRETYSRHFNLLMHKSFDEAPKGILTQLFKPTILLYGNRSIHYIHHGPGDQKTRQEMPLQKMSHSFELPSLEHVDPHSLDYMLRVFRVEGCQP